MGCTYSNSRSNGYWVASRQSAAPPTGYFAHRVLFAPSACASTRLEEFFTHAHNLKTQSHHLTQVSNGCCASSVQQLLSIAPLLVTSRNEVTLLFLDGRKLLDIESFDFDVHQNSANIGGWKSGWKRGGTYINNFIFVPVERRECIKAGATSGW